MSSHPSAVCGRLSPPRGEEERVNGERGKTFRVSSHEKTSEITSLTLWHASSPQRPKTRGRSVSRGRRKSPCRLVATSAARTVCPSDWVSMVIKMDGALRKKDGALQAQGASGNIGGSARREQSRRSAPGQRQRQPRRRPAKRRAGRADRSDTRFGSAPFALRRRPRRRRAGSPGRSR